MTLRFDDFYRLANGDNLGDVDAIWNPKLRDIDLRLNAAEGQYGKFDTASQSIITAGINRINTTIQPLLDSLVDQTDTLSSQVSALTVDITAQQDSVTATLNALIAEANDLVAGLSAATVFNSGTFAADTLQLIELWSNTPGAIPTAAQMPNGRFAINIADGLLFWKGSDGTIKSFALTHMPTTTAATQAETDNSTLIATTAFVQLVATTLFNEIVSTAPTALNTLNKLALAINDDANFSGTINAALAARLRFDAGQTLTTAQKLNGANNLGLATVARTGLYSDLTGAPTAALIAAFTQMAALTPNYLVSTDSISTGAAEQNLGSTIANNFTPPWTGFVNGYCTLTGPTVVKAPVTFPSRLGGVWRSILFIQDVTGGRTLSFDQPGVAGIATNVGYQFDSGVLPLIDTGANRATRINFLVTSRGFIEGYLGAKGIR